MMELVDMIRLSWIAFLHIGSSPIFDIKNIYLYRYVFIHYKNLDS